MSVDFPTAESPSMMTLQFFIKLVKLIPIRQMQLCQSTLQNLQNQLAASTSLISDLSNKVGSQILHLNALQKSLVSKIISLQERNKELAQQNAKLKQQLEQTVPAFANLNKQLGEVKNELQICRQHEGKQPGSKLEFKDELETIKQTIWNELHQLKQLSEQEMENYDIQQSIIKKLQRSRLAESKFSYQEREPLKQRTFVFNNQVRRKDTKCRKVSNKQNS